MLSLNLRGKKALVAGVGDDRGFGWAIAKALAEAGAEVIIATWTPLLKTFTTMWERGKFDESRRMSDGTLMNLLKVYPLDAVFDKPEDVPEEIATSKRYQDVPEYTVSELAAAVHRDFGTIDLLVHSMANGPEVQKPLLETSRQGYLAAISSSSYSFISLVQHFGPIMNADGSALTLTYLASTRTVPGYGGGMSSAKAALESDTRTLAWEAGRKWGLRVNAISAGAYGSRAAKAIGFIDTMIAYQNTNAPLQKELFGPDVGHAAAFLLSPLATAITGSVLYVDYGMNTMGVASDSASFSQPK